MPATISFQYPARFQRDEAGRFLVSFPDFPRAHTDGKDTASKFSFDQASGSSAIFWMVVRALGPHSPRQP